MKYIIIACFMINYSFASCILDEANPDKGCDDVFLIEDGKAVKLSTDEKLKEESVEAPKKDFHWIDELGLEEREWLKKNWY